MKFCPNAECPRYSGHTPITTFEDSIKTCPECDTSLVEEPVGNWVAITNPLLSLEARMLCEKLIANGISAYITDDNVSSFYILTTFGGAQVMVQAEDREGAWQVLSSS